MSRPALLCMLFFGAVTPVSAATTVRVETAGASFTIVEQPEPSTFVAGSSFTLDDVHGVFGGVAGTRSVAFFNNSLGGGFQVAGGTGITSEQIYIGNESAPFAEVGDYAAQDRASGAHVGLIIYENGATVPEPATWGLMVAGFGLVGAGLRRRSATASVLASR